MIEYIAGAAGAALLGYCSLIERPAVRLSKIELAFTRLPKAFDGFKIIHLSDLHVAHWSAVERRMEKIVRSLDADLFVITGDIAVRHKGAVLVKEFLRRARPDASTYIVFGNTEHKGDYGRRRREDLDWANLLVLTNEHTIIERAGESIVLAGVDDPFFECDDLGKALEGSSANAFKLLLAHAPSIAGEAREKGVDLLLSGHTHGGQIVFPVVGVLYPHIHQYKQLVNGLYEGEELSRILKQDAGEMRVYVNRGIGISNLPVRFMCPPEVVHITLRSK